MKALLSLVLIGISGIISNPVVAKPTVRLPKSDQILRRQSATYLFAPDYLGQKIHVRYIDSVPPVSAAINNDQNVDYTEIATPNCNPNSVAINSNKLYVACNKDTGNGDKILAYELGNAIARNQKFIPVKTITSGEFNSLIALAFDPQNNLWVSSYGNNKIAQISSANLASASPQVSKALVNSPAEPVGITFDSDGSLWVVGTFSGGIVVNIPAAELNKSGLGIDANVRYCLSKAAAGCPQAPNAFSFPEGIALLNGQIWVSNNGGDRPGFKLLALSVNRNQLEVQKIVGTSAGNPFSCPGGLFSYGKDLYINDQSYTLSNTSCGNGDASSPVDGVIRYTGGNFSATATPKVWKNTTSRPGFGGIAVWKTGS